VVWYLKDSKLVPQFYHQYLGDEIGRRWNIPWWVENNRVGNIPILPNTEL
jgi:hypothetical protein